MNFVITILLYNPKKLGNAEILFKICITHDKCSVPDAQKIYV